MPVGFKKAIGAIYFLRFQIMFCKKKTGGSYKESKEDEARYEINDN